MKTQIGVVSFLVLFTFVILPSYSMGCAWCRQQAAQAAASAPPAKSTVSDQTYNQPRYGALVASVGASGSTSLGNNVKRIDALDKDFWNTDKKVVPAEPESERNTFDLEPAQNIYQKGSSTIDDDND